VFFDDERLAPRKNARLRELPPVPDTDWRPPQYFPNLVGNCNVIGFDVETKETDWLHGPGWARGPKGHIIGFSVAARDRLGNCGKWYFPVRHEVEPSWNLDPIPCFSWLRHTLSTPSIPKIGQQLVYDCGWLTEEKIYVDGELHDIGYAQSILDEDSETSLDAMGYQWLGEGKETSLLYEWIRKAYNAPRRKERSYLWCSPPRLVGPYAETDADHPIRIFEKQWPHLVREELTGVYRMECNLIRLLVKMRIAGVRIDVDYVAELYGKFDKRIKEMYAKLHEETGVLVDSLKNSNCAKIFDNVGVEYPRSIEGKPIIQKDWLEHLDHPIGEKIVKIRGLEKLNSTFLKGGLLGHQNNGRIHCTFNALRSFDAEGRAGAKTGRLSSDDPNLQNIPVRTKEGKEIRAAFLPDEGHECWEKNDYSQIEYRYLAHYAVGPGSDELRADYNNNPKTDYHDRVYYAACPFLGYDPTDEALKDQKRRPIKNTNFGLVFGQGEGLLARKLGLSKKEAKAFFEGYHLAAPYVKPTMAEIAAEVQEHGYIRTILGRKVRFKLWEPIVQPKGHYFMPLSHDSALREYGPMIKLAFDYRGVNYKLQGSGTGDQIKMSMMLLDQDGVFDVVGVPKLQVHDELDHSVIDNSPLMNEAFRYMRWRMENAIPLRVPVFVKPARGADWSKAD
jgi:DNA polymerase I-like protein with 3'-5' exonuclease and polymerase domains